MNQCHFSSVEKKSILRLSSMVGLWLDYCSKNVDFFHNQTTWLQERWCNHRTKLCPLVGSGILVPWIILKTSHFVWFSKDFPGSIIQQTPTLNALMLFLLYVPRVYNNTSNTSNIFLGRCNTHGCVAITISIGLIGNPFLPWICCCFCFPQMKLSGVEIDLLFARLSSMTEAAMVTVTKTGGNVGSGSNDPLGPRIHKWQVRSPN